MIRLWFIFGFVCGLLALQNCASSSEDDGIKLKVAPPKSAAVKKAEAPPADAGLSVDAFAAHQEKLLQMVVDTKVVQD